MPDAAIVVRDLHKSYGEFEAVRGIDFDVQAGEIFAMLGPNGAGKTTTVEVLEGYRQRSGGNVEVLGSDPARASRGWRARIGVVLQTCQMPGELTVQESLELFAGYYPAPRSVPETMELVGLVAERSQRVGRLSGGQQRRLDMAIALIGNPELLFLDEPTTGFDPSARREAWETIAGLRDVGTTVLLTTHYMEEAQRLADRVAIMVGGQIVAEGPPGRIGRATPLTTIMFSLAGGVTPASLPSAIAADAEIDGDSVMIRTCEPQAALRAVLNWADESGVELVDLQARQESLEDVYLKLTSAA